LDPEVSHKKEISGNIAKASVAETNEQPTYTTKWGVQAQTNYSFIKAYGQNGRGIV
jgi:hypothetical protein